ATAFVAAAMLAWSRRRPALAGVLIGLGVATKLYPALLLGPLLVLGLRTGRMREAGRATVAAGAAWLAGNLPILLLFPRGWGEFFRFNAHRGLDITSIPGAVETVTGWRLHPHVGLGEPPVILNTALAVLLVVACAAIAYIGLTAPRRPRIA